MPAKYEKEIRDAFIEVYKSDWIMEDVDHDKAIAMTLAEIGETYESFSNKLEVGASNGHSVEMQLNLLKKVLKEQLDR